MKQPWHSISFRILSSVLLPLVLAGLLALLYAAHIEQGALTAVGKQQIGQLKTATEALLQARLEQFGTTAGALAGAPECVAATLPKPPVESGPYLQLLLRTHRLTTVAVLDEDFTVRAAAGYAPDDYAADLGSETARVAADAPRALFAEGPQGRICLLALAAINRAGAPAGTLLLAAPLALDASFRGSLLVRQGRIQAGSTGAEFLRPYVELMEKRMQATRTFDDDRLFVARTPVMGSGSVLGYVLTGVDLRDTPGAPPVISTRPAVTGLLLFLFAGCSALIYARGLCARVRTATAAVKTAQEGGDAAWPGPRPDALGELTDTLQSTLSTLVQDRDGLRTRLQSTHESAVRMRAEEQRLDALLEACREAIILEALDGRILFFNEAVCTMFGYSRDEILSRSFVDLVPPDIATTLPDTLRTQIKDGGSCIATRGQRKDGTGFAAEINARLVTVGGDQLVALYVREAREQEDRELRTGADQSKLQSQLNRSEKMHALGQLAGGIAHDFNNLLASIMGEANMLALDTHPGTATHAAAKTIEQAATRAAELTQQLLGFARKGKQRVIPIDVHAIIKETIGLLSRTIPKHIEIKTDFQAPNCTIEGDPAQMEQVVLNLAINARDAMSEGGTLTVTTVCTDLSADACAGHEGLRPGRHIEVHVSDTGHGIPPDVQERIFEPFFTTKKQGKGTGLGLATVYGIVANHGGTIDVESTADQGTDFRVLLPLIETAGVASGPVPPAPQKAERETKQILLVDDEEILRRVVSRMLGKLGLSVVAVTNGKEGVEYYQAHGDEIDLVILDMVMPVMGGRECFRHLKEFDPDVRVLVSTGSVFDGKIQELLDEGVLGFVQKPYKMDELGGKISEILG